MHWLSEPTRFEWTLGQAVDAADFIPVTGQELAAIPPEQVTANRDTASPWLVWREQLITRFRSLQPDEQRALDTLGAGGCFSEVCAVLATLMVEDEVPHRAADLLNGWLAQGLPGTVQSYRL